MGCCFSCKRLPSSANPSKSIKIVHLNGYIEELDYPLTVAEVTGKPAKHFLFTQAQLLSAGSSPLKLDALLELGCVYFLLPFSLFDTNVSPVDLAPIVRKLATLAQKSRSKSKSQQQDASCNSPAWSSPARSSKTDNSLAPHGSQKSSKSRSWKPILATIRERSFNQRSESDLQ